LAAIEEFLASPLAEGGTAFLALLAAAVAVLAALLYALRRRNTPEQRERRRRLRVHRQGRLTSGVVIDVEEAEGSASPRLLHYTYKIGAVEYSACQDVETLAETVGSDPKGVVGPASVKYHQKNPYNSIVVCEEWSGLRGARPVNAGEAT